MRAMPGKRVLLAAVAVLVVIGGGAAIAADRRKAQEPPPEPVRIRAALTQGRVDEVRRTVQVAMNNDGPAPITVEQVELLAPSFKGAGPVRVDAPLPVGGLRVDVPIPYGTGICTGDDLTPSSAASQVAFRVRTEDGRVRTVKVALAEHDQMLDQLLSLDCRQDYLDRRATFTFGPWRTLPKGKLGGTVVVKRADFAGTITLQEFAGSILLAVLPQPRGEQTPKPYGVLKPGVNELDIPVVVDGERCTPHVLAEIKKPYVFPAFVSLDGGEPLYTELKITDAERAAFKPVIDACAARAETS
jgi:hypothetical protein